MKNKQDYQNDFNIIQKLINEFDPCDLINFGAPKNEYDSLTYQILSALYQNKTKEKLKEIIFFEIEVSYGVDIKENELINQELEKLIHLLLSTIQTS
ncbi:hypothetical protein OX284_009325 [Flavobacterium sp. SUN046]|uniref:hypothetical protein n=1 Tax=Flavobacterium sp. SUN046 TaxID=3002440 RepID=UPI002DB73DD9|nr:hypothetical protein [Flavobacterium sp. SUN046]MEC4049627.1 hypothetical protein [Flavobacterium sp. SUN046]